MTETQPDLDKLRDEKCIPIARAVLADMVSGLLPEDANEKVDYNPLVLKMLQHSLDADLNLTTETPYLIQLVLGAFSGLNKTVQTIATVPIDEVRYAAIGVKILKILADSNVTLGSVTPDQTATDFATAKEQVGALVADEKLNMMEVKYIMDNIFDSFRTVSSMYEASIERQTGIAEAKLFGIEHMSDLSLKRLDEVLKK